MSIEANKAIARRHIEENWNNGNLANVEEIFAVDCQFHFSNGVVARGIDALKRGIAGFRTGFPDVRIAIEEVFAEGNQVVMRCTGHATHTGDHPLTHHIPPTGKPVTWVTIEIHHIRDGKIAESWRTWDRLGFLQQLEEKS